MSETSWEKVDKWYDAIVGEAGHYYHQHIVIPGVLRLLDLEKEEFPSLLDLACGQGILARALPKTMSYQGIDASSSLIKEARAKAKQANFQFSLGDICKPLPLKETQFTHAAIVLALQNVAEPAKALEQASKHLLSGGTLVIVLNHPCFRIPRQSQWGFDEENQIQFRRINRYLSPLKIPIQTHPSKGEKSTMTWTFHHPLSSFSAWLNDAGFDSVLFEEWTSDKKSIGKRAKMENRARAEFPLFLAIKAKKR